MDIQIRKAEKKDSTSILSLIEELATFEREPEAVVVTQEDIEKDGFGPHPLFECFVAEVENQVVGMALFYPRYSTWKGPTLHLEDLIVTHLMKEKGIGTRLYRAFIQYAFQKGVARIEWNVLDWNRPAISFYKKSGAAVLTDWRTVQMHRKEMEAFLNNTREDENI